MRYLFVSNLADVFKLLPILAHDRRQDKSERLRIIDRCKSGTAREQQEIHIGENIGDLGGLGIALKAYRLALAEAGIDSLEEAPVIDGLRAMERFFFSWARIWRSRNRDDYAELLLTIDPHSPNEFRCNGIVRNMDAFYETFDVARGDALWLAPEDRVSIW